MAITVKNTVTASAGIGTAAATPSRPAMAAESDQADHHRERPDHDRRDEVHGRCFPSIVRCTMLRRITKRRAGLSLDYDRIVH
jgi:hypothetical protein